jgi:hypothetical protein
MNNLYNDTTNALLNAIDIQKTIESNDLNNKKICQLNRRTKMNEANYPSSLSQSNFLDDDEKMADFEILTKEEFLTSYSYLTEQEYDNTKREVNND